MVGWWAISALVILIIGHIVVLQRETPIINTDRGRCRQLPRDHWMEESLQTAAEACAVGHVPCASTCGVVCFLKSRVGPMEASGKRGGLTHTYKA